MFFVCPSAHPGSSSIRCKALNPFCRQSMKTSDILMSPISGQEYPCATSTHQLIATIPNGPQRNKQRSRPPPRSAEKAQLQSFGGLGKAQQGPGEHLNGLQLLGHRGHHGDHGSIEHCGLDSFVYNIDNIYYILYIYYIYILYIYYIGYNWNLRLIQECAYPGNTRSRYITTICWP